MATTKKTKTKKNTTAEKVNASKNPTHPLIYGPRITEKSARGAEKGVYTFNIDEHANKNEIKKAIKMLYNVTAVKIAMTQVASKTKVRRGKLGTKSGGKKAVVYLKKGDTITFA